MTELEQLQIPPTPLEIAKVLALKSDETLTDAGKMVIRRLAFQLEALLQIKKLWQHALDCVDRVFQKCDEIPNPVLPDYCVLGEDKFKAVERLAKDYAAIADALAKRGA